MKEVVVLSAVRTAIGTYGGMLKDVPPCDLASLCVKESVARARIDPKAVEHVVFGNVIHTEARDMYLSRVAAVNGGLSTDTPAFTLNRLCGSGLQAIVSAAQHIETGHANITLAGGAECMSRGAYFAPNIRWGVRMNDSQLVDAMVGALTDPFYKVHMGITAENVAEKWGISREDQDKLAVESQKRATKATREGYFKDQIVPVEVQSRKQVVHFETDEHIRPDTTVESLAKLKPVFKHDGTVTAGNASGINDGAAALVLASLDTAHEMGYRPIARLIGYSHAGVEPKYMGHHPPPPSKKLL
ncbi:MAG: acetyl-CoA C-acyltransferase [Deinococcales bacterium]